MLLTALTPPLLPQGARAAAEAQAQPLAPRQAIAARASRKPARAPIKAPIKVVKEPNWRVILDKAVRDRARHFAALSPRPCTTVRASSPSCPFIRPVQAAGSKRGREEDEADMSTEDDLEVVEKKTPATTKCRCLKFYIKFRQI